MEYEDICKYGYPLLKCEEIINAELGKNKNKSTYPLFYQGKLQDLPVIEVPIQLPLYRVKNIRTKNIQKEWLATHPETEKDYFTKDPYSIGVQELQHNLLMGLVSKDKKIYEEFNKEQQTEPLICSDNGIVVNGNRRLCVWRDLYYHKDPTKFAHFQVIRIAVLPNHEEKAMYDLEVQLQVKKDIKAEYDWHAIAADCYEKEETGVDRKQIAEKQGKTYKDICDLIECYEYAKDYLEMTDNTDKWSIMDDKFFALKSAVSSRRKRVDAAERQLFEELVYSILRVPAKGDRLYSKIPKVEKNLERIEERIKEEFPIDDISDEDEDILLLSGGRKANTALVARKVRELNEPDKIVQIIETVIEDSEELEKERKKNSFVFDQILKAATCLKNALNSIDNEGVSKNGISKQLDNIEVSVEVIRNWLERDGHSN